MSRAAREAQAQDAAAAVARGQAPPRFARAPALATPHVAGAAPLPPGLRGDMEQRFGQDFSTVRIAGDRPAAMAAAGLGARAFAQGELIRFAAPSPDTRLVAHELTHVLQQRVAGRAEIACDGPGLDERVMTLASQLDGAADAKAREPLVAQALVLGEQLAAALAAATGAATPDEVKIDNLRTLLFLLGASLVRTDEGKAAVALAGKTQDTDARSRIVNSLAISADASVEGQETLMSQLAPLAGERVAAPGPAAQGRQWLGSNTAAVGKTLQGLDRAGLKGNKRESLSLERTEALLEGFLTHSDVNETPDPTGNPTGPAVRADETSHQIKADCDVYATTAARLLRAQGWQTVGYMVVVPTGYDAHAVSLSRKAADPARPDQGGLYLGSSNTELAELGGHGNALASEAAALEHLVTLMLDVYAPMPDDYDIYFLPALAGGAYDTRLLDPVNSGLVPWRSKRAATKKAEP